MAKPRRTKEQREKDIELLRSYRKIKFIPFSEQIRRMDKHYAQDTLRRFTMTTLAEEALGKIRPDAREAVPALIELLSNQEISIRWAAADALGAFGSDALEAVPSLTHMLDNSFVRCWESDESALLRTQENLDQHRENWEVDASNCRCSAARALGDIGPAAKEGAPSLIRAMKDDDGGVREGAVRALGKIGAVTVDVVPALIEALDDSRVDVCEAGSKALAAVGVESPAKTVPLLLEVVLSDGNERVQYRATDALCLIGSAATSALIDALADARSEVRRRAAKTLGDMQSDARDAVPALTKALEDQDAGVRESVADALKEINETDVATG